MIIVAGCRECFRVGGVCQFEMDVEEGNNSKPSFTKVLFATCDVAPIFVPHFAFLMSLMPKKKDCKKITCQ